MRFARSFLIDPSVIDEQGHVNNIAYLQWIQSIAIAHWRFAATREMIERFSWVVVRHEIDYKKPGFAGEDITVSTWLGEWTRVSCERFTEIQRGGDLLVKGRTIWCMVDRKSLRPTQIERNLIELFN